MSTAASDTRAPAAWRERRGAEGRPQLRAIAEVDVVVRPAAVVGAEGGAVVEDSLLVLRQLALNNAHALLLSGKNGEERVGGRRAAARHSARATGAPRASRGPGEGLSARGSRGARRGKVRGWDRTSGPVVTKSSSPVTKRLR